MRKERRRLQVRHIWSIQLNGCFGCQRILRSGGISSGLEFLLTGKTFVVEIQFHSLQDGILMLPLLEFAPCWIAFLCSFCSSFSLLASFLSLCLSSVPLLLFFFLCTFALLFLFCLSFCSFSVPFSSASICRFFWAFSLLILRRQL